MPELAEVIADAKDVLRDARITPEVLDSALDILELAKTLAEKDALDITDLLSGDPKADRAIFEAAKVQAEIGRSIDWKAVGNLAFQVAGALAKVAAVLV